MPEKPLSKSLLVTLGLTGIFTSAVRCGPCLDIVQPDSGEDTEDTGQDTGKGADRDAQSSTALPPNASDDGVGDVVGDVLARGVLPDDVARLLAQRTKDTSG